MPNNPSANKRKRSWSPKDAREENIIRKFLQICDEKLTASLMAKFHKEDLQSIIDRIYKEEITFNHLSSLTEDELHDFIVDQGRLF